MAAAYRYADGDGPPPDEIKVLSYIDRFGTQAVFGRTLTPGELRRMAMAENVINAYRSCQVSDNWVEWTKNNPDMAALLNAAMLLAEGGDNG